MTNTDDPALLATRLLLANLAENRMGDDENVLDDIGDDADSLRDVAAYLAYQYAWNLINQHGRDEANRIVMRVLAAGTEGQDAP